MIMVRALIARFWCSDFMINAAILSFGRAVSQGVVIAVMPIMTRLYTPANFGVLAFFLAVSSIVATVITLRYETSILLPKEDDEAKSLVLLSLAVAVFVGLFVSAIAWILPGKIRMSIGVSVLGGWLPIAILTGVGTALVAIGTAWLNRKQSYSKIAQLHITQSVLSTSTAIVMGLYGYATGLLVAQMVSVLIVCVVVIAVLRSMRAQWNMKTMSVVAVKHRSAPKYLLPTALLDVVTLQLPVLLITAWYSSEAAGQFSMAWTILSLPMSLIGGAVGQVFLQRFSQVWPDARSARQLLFRTWKTLAIVGALPTILVMLFGEQLFPWVLGSAWREAGRMAAVIAPMLLSILVSSPTSGIFLVLGLQKFSLMFGIASFVYRTSCIFLGVMNDSVLSGLAAWVLCELSAIFIYNKVALMKMGKR